MTTTEVHPQRERNTLKHEIIKFIACKGHTEQDRSSSHSQLMCTRRHSRATTTIDKQNEEIMMEKETKSIFIQAWGGAEMRMREIDQHWLSSAKEK